MTRGEVTVTMMPVTAWAAFDPNNKALPVAIHADDAPHLAGEDEATMHFTLNLTRVQALKLYREISEALSKAMVDS